MKRCLVSLLNELCQQQRPHFPRPNFDWQRECNQFLYRWSIIPHQAFYLTKNLLYRISKSNNALKRSFFPSPRITSQHPPLESREHSWRAPTWCRSGWASWRRPSWGTGGTWAGRPARRSGTASCPRAPSGSRNTPAPPRAAGARRTEQTPGCFLALYTQPLSTLKVISVRRAKCRTATN